MKDVKEIVITGGPCSGKTEGIAFVKKKLEKMGWRVFTAREKATDVILGGVRDLQELAKKDPKKYLELQKAILEWQICDVNQIRKLASIFQGEPRVVLYDRGPQDNAAYVRWDIFHGFLKDLGLNAKETCFDFDAVIHMVTAADGAEEHYNLTNPARSEKDLKDVKDLDHRTLSVWLGHPHLFIIDNSTDFPGKLARLEKVVLRALGIPKPAEIERKFLLERFFTPPILEVLPGHRVKIEQTYVDIPNKDLYGLSGKCRIRKETHYDGTETCYLAKKTGRGIKRRELEIEINSADYVFLSGLMVPEVSFIRKIRHYFIYCHKRFVADLCVEPPWVNGLWVLEVELLDEDEEIKFPLGLHIEKEVTGDPEYTNLAIAKKR